MFSCFGLLNVFEDPSRPCVCTHLVGPHLLETGAPRSAITMQSVVSTMTESILHGSGARFRRNVIECYERALAWVRNNTIPEQGVIVSSRNRDPYLEVTGYLIPTLLEAGETHLAEQYAEYLSYMQRPDGAFSGPDGKEYAFDTGQALRGLLCAATHWDRYSENARRAANYLTSCVKESGQIPADYGSSIPESVHVYVLPALLEASTQFGAREYSETAERSLDYYTELGGILDDGSNTHFLGYVLDGFIDCGRADVVKSFSERIFRSQKPNGSIPAFAGARWTCSPGLAQLAIIGYKLGLVDQSDAAIRYLCRIQNASGGFFGSYGMSPRYFPREEISWACKFFLDAVHLKIRSFFDRNAAIFPSEIRLDDARLDELVLGLGNLKNAKILDAGCGKGRFAVRLRGMEPSVAIYGVDISDCLLDEVPDGIIKKRGTILDLPFEDETFDGVYCVEALEHTIRTERAIDELCRVLKDHGKIVIIDKSLSKQGSLVVTDFEQWFDGAKVKGLLEKHCSDVRTREIGYDGKAPDGLFLSWVGDKDSNLLDSEGWHRSMVAGLSPKKTADRIRGNSFPTWIKPLMLRISAGQSALEMGSGTGELSAILGVYGRIPILVDYSRDNLEFSGAVFRDLGLEAEFVCSDLLIGLPFAPNAVDWVWSSGLLEHYHDEQVTGILRDAMRVSRKGVISLAPNAHSVPYRAGKRRLEQEGRWIYGREIPRYSMKDLFKDAGLTRIQEYSVGHYHALNFMGRQDQLRDLYDSLGHHDLEKLNQGYLLVTVGEKSESNEKR